MAQRKDHRALGDHPEREGAEGGEEDPDEGRPADPRNGERETGPGQGQEEEDGEQDEQGLWAETEDRSPRRGDDVEDEEPDAEGENDQERAAGVQLTQQARQDRGGSGGDLRHKSSRQEDGGENEEQDDAGGEAGDPLHVTEDRRRPAPPVGERRRGHA